MQFHDENGSLYGVKQSGNRPQFSCQILDENGLPFGIKHIGNKPRVSAMPYLFDIAEGNVANHYALRALGYNGAVGTSEEDLWEVGGSYVPPTGGMGMEVLGGAQDTIAGTGIQKVMIHYLDTSYAEQTEEVEMNGATPVATSATDILRINEFHASQVGTGGVAAGNVQVRHLSDTPVYSQITAGGNVAMTAFWTVPADKTAYITCWAGGCAGGNKDARFLLRTTSSLGGVLNAGIFQFKDVIVLEDSGLHIPFSVPIKVPAQADIKISVVSAANGALAAGHFEGWYE